MSLEQASRSKSEGTGLECVGIIYCFTKLQDISTLYEIQFVYHPLLRKFFSFGHKKNTTGVLQVSGIYHFFLKIDVEQLLSSSRLTITFANA